MAESHPLSSSHTEVVSSESLKASVISGETDANFRDTATGSNLVHLAAISNQVETIHFLVGECKVDINAQDSDGNTALHLAVIHGHLEATAAILSHAPVVTLCNKEQVPPLHIAIEQGAKGVSIVAEFVRHAPTHLLVKGHLGYTTLHVIAKNNNLEALKLIHAELVRQKVHFDLLEQDRNSLTALHLAACTDTHKVLSYLLSNCDDCKQSVDSFTNDSRTPLHCAIERGHVECVRVLVQHGADPTMLNGKSYSPILLACAGGRLDIVKKMVELAGKDILQARGIEGVNTLHSSSCSFHSRELIA